jgi:phage terminase small subunit
VTPKQEAFVREYLADPNLNATQAYIRAGYKARGNSAETSAARLLRNVQVANAVAAAMGARSERAQATADRVLREIENLGMIDPAALVGVRGPKDIAKLPEHVRRAIVGWSYDRRGRFQVKLAKEGALEMLARHHGMFNKDKSGAGTRVIIKDMTGRKRGDSGG